MNVGTSNYYDSFWEFSQFKEYFNVPAVLYLNQNRKKNKIIELGEKGLKLETYESICWEKNAWFPIIMFPWRNPSNYRTPFPNNWLFLQLRIQNPGPEELNGIQIFRCGTWLLHFRFRYGSKFIAWQEPRFFFHFCWYGWNHPAGSLLPAGKSHQKQPIFQSNFVTV